MANVNLTRHSAQLRIRLSTADVSPRAAAVALMPALCTHGTSDVHNYDSIAEMFCMTIENNTDLNAESEWAL